MSRRRRALAAGRGRLWSPGRALAGLFLLLAAPALAQPIFPAGSPIGLEPPPGFVPSLAFAGFAQREGGARILLAEQPGASLAAARASLAPARLARQGIAEARLRELRVAGREAVLAQGRQGTNTVWLLLAPGADQSALVTVLRPGFPAPPAEVAAIEAALATLVLRPVDLAAARAALPFAFEETPRLRFRRAVAGAAAVLADPQARLDNPEAARLTIATSLAATPPPADRRAAAEAALRASLPGAVIEEAGTLRLGATEAVLVTARQGPRRIAQWVLFFAGGGTLRVLAEAPATEFAGLAPEFEQVVASIRRP